jgi:TonB family protein
VQFASCKKPHYPAESHKAGNTGTVTLGFLVDSEGRAVDSRVDASSGHADLDTEAREAIARCQFRPATQGGKPVQAWMKMKYEWRLV